MPASDLEARVRSLEDKWIAISTWKTAVRTVWPLALAFLGVLFVIGFGIRFTEVNRLVDNKFASAGLKQQVASVEALYDLFHLHASLISPNRIDCKPLRTDIDSPPCTATCAKPDQLLISGSCTITGPPGAGPPLLNMGTDDNITWKCEWLTGKKPNINAMAIAQCLNTLK